MKMNRKQSPNSTVFIEKARHPTRDKYDGPTITGESYSIDIRVKGMRFSGLQFYGTEEQQEKAVNDILEDIRNAEVEIVK